MRRASLTPSAPFTPNPLRRPKSEYLDDYNYHDLPCIVSQTKPIERLGDQNGTLTGHRSDDPDGSTAQLESLIFERSITSNRAKLPDGYHRIEGAADGRQSASGEPNRRQPVSPVAPTHTETRKRKRDRFRHRHIHTGSRPGEDTILRKVDLHWSREEAGETDKVSLDACEVSDDSSKPTALILWQ